MNPAAPTAIVAAKYPIAQKPTFGGENKVYLSRTPGIEVGSFEVQGLNSGTYTADPVNPALLSATPSHLIAVVDNEMDGGASNVVITVTGTNSADAPITGTATYAPVAWHRDQTRYWGQGQAVPVEVTADAKFKTITGVTVTNAAGAATAIIKLFGVPDQSTFTLVACQDQADFTTKANPAKEIPCGMDGSAFVKRGRSEPGKLTINSKAVDFGDGLMKYNGATNITAMIKVVKEGTLETGRIYFFGYTVTAKGSNPDGDGFSMFEAEGLYEDLGGITAKGS
jgi:hypothetical protein